MITDRRAFIVENTRLQAPPHAPELRLHLADEITPIGATVRRTGPDHDKTWSVETDSPVWAAAPGQAGPYVVAG